MNIRYVTKKVYQVTNSVSGHGYGRVLATSPEDAIEVHAQLAGYSSSNARKEHEISLYGYSNWSMPVASEVPPTRVTRDTPGVTIKVRVEEETDSPYGHFENRDQAKEVIKRANGNIWGWCTVWVTVSWEGFSGEDNLGCCSYDSEEEFRADAYYSDLVNQALDQLNKDVDKAREAIAKLDGEIA
jgi:hypothetical protein